MPAGVLIVNLAVLVAVLWADLGTRAITWSRALWPAVIAAIVIGIFFKSPQTAGRGLDLELGGLAVGLLLGVLAALRLMVIRVDPATDEPVTEAGPGYAGFWITVIALRIVYTYGAHHWYAHPLGTWKLKNGITTNGITDALILLAIGLVLARVLRLALFLYLDREAERIRALDRAPF